MTSAAYPGRSGLTWQVSRFFNSSEYKLLSFHSDTLKVSGTGLSSELNLLINEKIELRGFSNSATSLTCVDSSINIPKFRHVFTSGDPTVSTSFNSFNTSLVSTSNTDDLLDYDVIGTQNVTFTSADVFTFQVPDTSLIGDGTMFLSPNRLFDGSLFYSAGAVAVSAPSGGFITVTCSNVTPTQSPGFITTMRLVGLVHLSVDELINSINPGSPTTYNVDFIGGRQIVSVF